MPGILTWMILLPVLAAAAVASVDRRHERGIQMIGVASTVVVFLLAAGVWARFASGTPGLQFGERVPWVPGVGIVYHRGGDGLSVTIIALTALLFPLALASAAAKVRTRVKRFVITVLLIEAGMSRLCT